MTYTPAHVRMPESSVINIKNCSFRITANIEINSDASHGVIVCQGGNMAGWSLYLDEQSRPTFHYNWFGHEHTSVASSTPLTGGKHQIVVAFAYDGGFGAGGDVTIFVHNDNGNKNVDSARIDKTVPLVYSMSGETFDVGVDTGSPVGPYPHGFDCTAIIHSVVVERLDEPPAEIKQKMREGEFRASLSTQ
jgi:arylsulfatase